MLCEHLLVLLMCVCVFFVVIFLEDFVLVEGWRSKFFCFCFSFPQDVRRNLIFHCCLHAITYYILY